jgi:hypothetical protein
MKGTWKILNEFVNRKKTIQKASASWPEITDTSRIRQRTFSMWDWVLRFTERQKCKFNMADKRSVQIDYNQLHHISSELLYETKPRKRLVKKHPKTFQVERIIARRTTKKVRNMLDINILILLFNCDQICLHPGWKTCTHSQLHNNLKATSRTLNLLSSNAWVQLHQ